MFTGLVHHTGVLRRPQADELAIAVTAELHASFRLGDSVAVNGVCLTVAELSAGEFSAHLLPATLEHTTLGELPTGSVVNIEPALRAGDQLGGHIVQGHVDGTTELLTKRELPGGDWRYTFALPDWLRDWVVPKGSICIDGVSLTVQELRARDFSVELIPVTLELTNLGSLEAGRKVNLEADLIVKTISRLLAQRTDALQPHFTNSVNNEA